MLHLIYFHVCASMCETTENIPPRLSRQKVPCHPPTGTVHQDECGWGRRWGEAGHPYIWKRLVLNTFEKVEQNSYLVE
jgi:hypothetical protein